MSRSSRSARGRSRRTALANALRTASAELDPPRRRAISGQLNSWRTSSQTSRSAALNRRRTVSSASWSRSSSSRASKSSLGVGPLLAGSNVGPESGRCHAAASDIRRRVISCSAMALRYATNRAGVSKCSGPPVPSRLALEPRQEQ